MHSIAGKIAGNAIIAEPQELAKYEGCDVVITILQRPDPLPKKKSIDFDSYCTETVRGKMQMNTCCD